MSYRFGLFDAQYFLTRNSFALGDGLSVSTLLSSFFMSIHKINKELEARKIILLWDSPPYFKSEILDDYKGDRLIASDEIDRLSGLIASTSDKDELEGLNKQLDSAKRSHEIYKIRSECKNILVNEGSEIGFPSLRIRGLEADDLAYLSGIILSQSFGEYDKSVLVSSDSDWEVFTSSNCDFYRTIKNSYLVNFSDSAAQVPNELTGKITPFIHRQLSDLYFGNHNNVSGNAGTVSYQFTDLVDSYCSGTLESFDSEVYKKLCALDVSQYLDTYKTEILNTISSSGTHDLGAMFEFTRNHEMEIYPNVIKAMYRRLAMADYQFI